MSEKTKQLDNCAFRVDLDSEIKTLSGKSLKALLGLFAHLENLGLRNGQCRDSALGGDRSATLHEVLAKSQPFGAARLKRPCFRDLGRQVISAAKAQVLDLGARNQKLQSLVLINSWPVAEQLWSEFLPDCKTPLFMLSFLEDLWGINPGQSESNSHALARHWHRFILIQAEIENLMSQRQSLLELSNALELHLGTWLEGFGKLLEKLDEESIA
jgi:hypothetical protein